MTPETLHAVYCRESGLNVHFRLGPADTRCERAWMDFLKIFTEADLVTVIRYLKRGIKSGDRRPGCLKFRNLIEPLNMFDEELQEARAQERNRRKPPTNREQALRDTHRLTEATPEPKTPKVILDEATIPLIAKLREAAK